MKRSLHTTTQVVTKLRLCQGCQPKQKTCHCQVFKMSHICLAAVYKPHPQQQAATPCSPKSTMQSTASWSFLHAMRRYHRRVRREKTIQLLPLYKVNTWVTSLAVNAAEFFFHNQYTPRLRAILKFVSTGLVHLKFLQFVIKFYITFISKSKTCLNPSNIQNLILKPSLSHFHCILKQGSKDIHTNLSTFSFSICQTVFTEPPGPDI